MEKSRLLFVTLTTEQIEKVKEENGLSNRSKPTHAIIYENHGQIFGTHRQMDNLWANWTSKEKRINQPRFFDMFLECIKTSEYDFKNYDEIGIQSAINDDWFEFEAEYNTKQFGPTASSFDKSKIEPKKKKSFIKELFKVIFYIFILMFIIEIASK